VYGKPRTCDKGDGHGANRSGPAERGRPTNRPDKSTNTRVVALSAILSVLLTGLIALLVQPFDPDRACCDHLFYRSMSYNLFTVTRPDLNVPPRGNPLPSVYGIPTFRSLSPLNRLNRQPPYVFRIVTPLLARLVAYATGINAAYYLISFLALAGAAVFIALSIFKLTGSQIPAMAGAVLFLVHPYSARFNLHRFMLTDPLAFLLTALAIWALVQRKRGLFFVACAFGVLNKESMLPILIAYPLTEAWIEHHVRWTSVSAVIGITVGWYAFRLAMPIPVNTYSLASEFRGGLRHVELMAGAGILAFGVMLPAAVRRPWGSRLMIALVPFALACILEAWFVDDLERVMAQALPAICVVVLWWWPTERPERLLTLAVVPLATLAAIVYSLGWHSWTVAPSLVALAVEIQLVLLARRRGAPVT
jgi:hypothetical protein